VKVDIGMNINDVTRYMTNIDEKQMPFATSLALTRLAKGGQKDTQAEMKRLFDRPTPYTIRSVYVQPAKKKRQVAVVGIKDRESSKNSKSPADQLRHEFRGGSRGRSRLEFWLERAGKITSREYLVPGEEARLDRYGNISRGQVQQIMSQIKVGADAISFSSDSRRSKRKRGRLKGYFWSDGRQLPKGVWQRDGGDAVPIMIVVTQPTYRAMIDIRRVVNEGIRKRAKHEIAKAVRFAIQTAR